MPKQNRRQKASRQPSTSTVRSKAEKNRQFAEAYGGSEKRVHRAAAQVVFPEPVFERDERKTNPGLHRLYVEWAVRHLAIFEQAIAAFSRESNLNMLDGLSALITERDTLIKTNAAYAEAEKLINVYRSVHPLRVDREIQYNEALDKS